MSAAASLPPGDLDEIIQRLGAAWADLDGARILLTGCSGFFGPWLLEPLLEAGNRLGLELEVWLLTRDPEAFRARLPWAAAQPRLHLLQGDVRAWEDPGIAFTHLIHGAASSNPQRDPQDGEATAATIVGGTARILASARRCAVRRALYLSSGAVYGTQPPALEAVPESYGGAPDPADPAAAYGLAKRLAENLCATSRVPVTVARCFAFLAPHLPLDVHFAAGNFIGDALAGRPIRVKGDGRPRRSYLYGTDLACWLWTLLLEGEPGRAYNVGSERAVSIAELARAVAAQTGVAVEIALPPGQEPPPSYVPSTTRARGERGLEVRVDLDEAIGRTLAWHRSREAP